MFVERLCHESESLASGDAERALKLANLALGFAERAPSPPGCRRKLEAYALIFVGNAHRVAGSLPSAETAFAQAERAWASWEGVTPVSLADWRLPDMKASLCRHQGRFEEALALHNQALGLAQPEATGLILLNKAFTLEQQGEAPQALATLGAAERALDPSREPRLLCVLEFNRVVNLCRLEQFAEAEKRLSALQAIVKAGERPLDQVRVIWLESKIAAGLGRRTEAVELLDQVRREFLVREIAYDTALATLELAVLYLEDGRNAEVRRIAAELAPIFAAQRVTRETLACVDLFCKAVQQETVTAELARGWLRELSRAG
jgi:tetratricopeptide (TPR) repeat protein